jgi:AcrR family transcriptional regulator
VWSSKAQVCALQWGMAPNARQGRRPGGRSAAVLASITTAVEELVAERGRDRVTVPMVAERAGVNHSSIYRRWGDAQAMINDLATYRLDPDRALPATGNLRDDLTAWANEMVEHYREPAHAALLRAGAATAGETESDCLRDRRAEAAMLVEHALEPRTVTSDDVINHVVAPIIYRVIFLPWTLDESTAAALVEELFLGRGPGPVDSA